MQTVHCRMEVDILVIPGVGNATTLKTHPNILAWIRQIHQTTIWIASVCTGSLIFGAAGILDGIKATTNRAEFERLNSYGSRPIRVRVVEDGKVMTTAGVSAGIDMALLLALKVIGPEFAQTMQLALKYDPNPPFDTGFPDKVSIKIRESLKARMVSFFEEESPC